MYMRQEGIIIPTGFIMIDSSSHTMSLNAENSVWLKQFLFTKDDATFGFFLSSRTQNNVDYKDAYKKETKHFFDQTRIINPKTKFDSSSTEIILDSKSFNKFIVTGKQNGVITYNHTQLDMFYKGYKINIAYNFTKKENENDIENSLNNLKFE